MGDDDLIRELVERIQDSDEYCSVYGMRPPVLYAIAVSHMQLSPTLEDAQIAWQLDDDTIVSLKEKLASIPASKLAELTGTTDLDSAIDTLHHADDDEIAAMLAAYVNKDGERSNETVVFARRRWTIDPTTVFLTRDEAVAEMESNRHVYGKDARISILALKETSLLAKLIESLPSWIRA